MSPDELAQREQSILSAHAKTDDPIGIVIRGHLFVEQALREMLEAYLPRPSHGLRKPKYNSLLSMIDNLGLITESERKLLWRVNKLRDDVGHDPHFIVTAEHERELFNLSEATFVDGHHLSVDDASLFPGLMASTLLALSLSMRNRAEQLKARRLPDIAKELQDTDKTRLWTPLLSMGVVLLERGVIQKLVGALLDGLSRSTDAPSHSLPSPLSDEPLQGQ